MSNNINLAKATEIMEKYNKEAFHVLHGKTVSGVMGYFAKKHDPQNEEHWRVVGMLHDTDFEEFPEEHCVKGIELLRNENVPDDIIKSAMSHGWGMTDSPYEPELFMEKVLFTIDELTGLIGAAALMRPSKSTMDMELSSVKKKFKDKKFAAGCSRDTIKKGVEMMEMDLDHVINETILAMREVEANAN